jgi:hypothetical protein
MCSFFSCIVLSQVALDFWNALDGNGRENMIVVSLSPYVRFLFDSADDYLTYFLTDKNGLAVS